MDKEEPIENLITWVFDEGSFTPCAKITEEDVYSIICDYIGKPVLAYNSFSNQVWSVEYDIYGNIRSQHKGEKSFIPFRNQGQYEDEELGGLMYNRFRYYDGSSGTYISQDPIGLAGGTNLYEYVKDTNTWVDIFGLVDLKILLKEDPAYEYSDEIKPDKSFWGKKYFQVIGHGSPTKMGYTRTDTGIKPEEVAQMIKAHPNYKEGMVVKLYSCSTGIGGKSSFAQSLADLLNTAVYAPDNILWLNSDGTYYIAGYHESGLPDMANSKTEFTKFKPQKKLCP